MARVQFFVLSILCSFAIISIAGENYRFSRTLDRKLLGLKKEKLSHFRFYWHDVLSGRKPTAIKAVLSPSNITSNTAFGQINVIDDALTLGPKNSSKMVGKAQGIYASAAQQEIGLLMIMNFGFVEGKYNGSTITVLGRNLVMNKEREISVIGGSGLFRFARGYAKAKTYKFDMTTGDAIVEYNVYVLHY